MSDCLHIENLSVRDVESGRKLVENVSLRLPHGGSLVLIGQSGSGKTMLCRCVMDLFNRKSLETDGQIFFHDQEILSMRPRLRRKIYGKRIALIPQNPMTAFDPSQKMARQMRETLQLHRKFSRFDADEAIQKTLKDMGLTDPAKVGASYPFMLSGGMLQRCAIAMAIVLDAELVLADEPTTALDAEHRIEITNLLVSLRQTGTSLLFVTHDFVSARQFGGSAAVMKDGKITERGTVEQLLTHPADAYTRQLAEAALI